MIVPAALAELVKSRAGHRCEYCGMSQSLQGATFHLDHIIPLSCGGPTAVENLSFACPSCNLHKSDRSHVIDPLTNTTVAIFHPRNHVWSEHFVWQARTVIGITPIGRATILCLDLNHPRRLRVREAEAIFSLFPPPTQEK